MTDNHFLQNGLIAFVITVGWSLIFYPYLRSIKASYRRLLFWSVIMSALVLVGREFIFRFIPKFDIIFAYFLGIFLAAILITLLFGYRKKSYKQLPARLSSFEHEHQRHGPRIRLRHIVLMGVLIEDEVRRLYLYFAETSKDKEVKKIFEQLAADEQEHKEFFENIHRRWLPVPLEKQIEEHLVEKLFERKGILPPLHDKMTKDEVFKYAYAMEQLTIEFYELFKDHFRSEWKRKQIRKIIKEERRHIDDIKSYEKRWRDKK